MEHKQVMEFQGFIINPKTMMIYLPEEKTEELVSYCDKVLSVGKLILRKLTSLIGKLTKMYQAVLPAPLYYRGPEIAPNKNDSEKAVVRETMERRTSEYQKKNENRESRVWWHARVIKLLWRPNFGTVWVQYQLGVNSPSIGGWIVRPPVTQR